VVEVASFCRLSAAGESAVLFAGAHKAGKAGAGYVAPRTDGRDCSGCVDDPRPPGSVGSQDPGDISGDGADPGDLGRVVDKAKERLEGHDNLDLRTSNRG
jgi:hypothetical protein